MLKVVKIILEIREKQLNRTFPVYKSKKIVVGGILTIVALVFR